MTGGLTFESSPDLYGYRGDPVQTWDSVGLGL